MVSARLFQVLELWVGNDNQIELPLPEHVFTAHLIFLQPHFQSVTEIRYSYTRNKINFLPGRIFVYLMTLEFFYLSCTVNFKDKTAIML